MSKTMNWGKYGTEVGNADVVTNPYLAVSSGDQHGGE